MMGWSPRCYIPSFVEIRLPVLEKKIFEGFYHIWAWRQSWSCDPDAANKISFPLTKEAPHKIWLRSAKRFLRRRCLSIVNGRTDGRTTTDDVRRTPDHGYTISSPMSLWLRLAKNKASEHTLEEDAKMEACHFLSTYYKRRLNSDLFLYPTVEKSFVYKMGQDKAADLSDIIIKMP